MGYLFVIMNLLFVFCSYAVYFLRVVRSVEVNLKVDEWEMMMVENEALPDELKKEVPKLEDMQVHYWQAAALGALHEAGEAFLLGNLIIK